MPTYPFNPAKAAALLDADGFVKGPNGVLRKNGRPFAITLWSSDETANLINQVLQQEWGRLGLKVTLRAASFSFILGPTGPFLGTNAMAGATLTNLNNPDIDDSTYWVSAGIPKTPADYAHCCNDLGFFHRFGFQAQIDALYAAGNSTLDPARRRAIYFQIQDVLADEVPVIFLYWEPQQMVLPSTLVGFVGNPFLPSFNTIGSWRQG